MRQNSRDSVADHAKSQNNQLVRDWRNTLPQIGPSVEFRGSGDYNPRDVRRTAQAQCETYTMGSKGSCPLPYLDGAAGARCTPIAPTLAWHRKITHNALAYHFSCTQSPRE